MVTKPISIIIPTYTGQEHIADMLASLLNQAGHHNYEVIVVIDGPNVELRHIVNSSQKQFAAQKIVFKIYQFSRNQGRFAARYKGAQLAKYQTLLFADDRNLMDKNYLNHLTRANEAIIIPNVIQSSSPSPISRLLYLVRKKIYKQWGEDFEPYYINSQNFEKSSKGTTGLWIDKDLFIAICQKMASANHDLKNVNEDTKLLKDVIERGYKIYRSSDAKIYYQPRVGLKPELLHLYERGPRFVDYYLRPKTRFFYPLILVLVSVLALPIALAINLQWSKYLIITLACIDVIAALLLARRLYDLAIVIIFLPLVVLALTAGIIKGTIRRLL